MTTTTEDYTDLARDAVTAAENFNAAIESQDFGPNEDELGWLNNSALEMYANVKRYLTDTGDIVKSITVVLGTGGPHYQYTLSPSGEVTGEAWGWFGAGAAEKYGSAPELAAFLFDLFEEWGQ